MKIRPIFLITILVLFTTVCIKIASAAKLKAFKPPRTEEQMLVWLKERNYEVEKLDGDLYAISWEQELSDGEVEGVYGEDVCKVLIESINGKNTARFTYSLRLNITTNVIVSSDVKWINPSRQNSIYHFYYHIENLPSGKPVNTFYVYYPLSMITTTQQDGFVLQHFIPKIKDISNPSGPWGGWEQQSSQSGLWENSEEFSRLRPRPGHKRRIIWTTGEIGIIAAQSLSGFAIDIVDGRYRVGSRDQRTYLVLPGITPACIDVDRHSKKITPIFRVDGQIRDVSKYDNPTTDLVVIIEGDRINISSKKTVEEFLDQIRPRGNVIGPEVILKSADALKLIERLEEKLIVQCVSEGWLDKSAAKLLKQHLVAGHTALQDNQSAEARQAIQAFIDTLKQMEGTEPDDSNQEPPLTQEALTLLGTNAASLLRTIPVSVGLSTYGTSPIQRKLPHQK